MEASYMPEITKEGKAKGGNVEAEAGGRGR
jgi:hypothetical protein